MRYVATMSDATELTRSPELMSRRHTALLVVDMQIKLLNTIHEQTQIVWNARRLIDGAQLLGVPIFGTEQYPAGLGATTDSLATRLGELPEKKMFSCRECGGIFQQLQADGLFQLLVVGIETHVCVQQTVLDAIAAGFQCFIAVDAVASRFAIDRDTALRRLEGQGATLTTTEAALFEWCETADIPEFKAISKLVRETCPDKA
jgi:nicotinamidase-related amidase